MIQVHVKTFIVQAERCEPGSPGGSDPTILLQTQAPIKPLETSSTAGQDIACLIIPFFFVSLWRLWWWWIQQWLDLQPMENKPEEKSGPQSPVPLRDFGSLHCRYRYTAVVFRLLLEEACLHYQGSPFHANIKLIINLPVILFRTHQSVHQD